MGMLKGCHPVLQCDLFGAVVHLPHWLVGCNYLHNHFVNDEVQRRENNP